VPAIERAGQLGFWGVEFDLIVTSDGEFMLMHDNTVDRTTDGTGNVTSFTFAQMKALNIDGVFNVSAYPNTKVPTLREALQACVKYSIVPQIHRKTLTDAELTKLISILNEFGLQHKSVIATYDATVLERMSAIDPMVVVGIIYGDIIQTNIDT